ncbi:MAG TPA: GIY-YIG nuclease family protein [Bacteroides mediterraneensis]|uniref:GIY-YIG nuclease family protein n=1 Tax=Bacteroides mediterraneensis TaxID=1841856 RepID=UPI0026184953|nr:GIY-YIG nuclease family protein [Bacteroides mediterraneensis]HJH64959.1 GIY-YIG nuclease family protein [Bacteroides mediterraneensis]
MEQNYFPQRPTVTPTIYAYRLLGVDSHKGYLKVGYTDRTAKERIDEQLHTSKIRYEIVLIESAMTNDGSCFTDKDVHKLLERKGFHRLNPLDKTDEWFDCSMEDVKAAILSLRTGSENVENRTQNFGMRPEQFRAVEQTKSYFEQAVKEEPNRIPKFLWNAKMRFGKTFASYQLAKKMNLSRILVLTFKPAVESAWREDLVSHIDFEGWQFISNKDAKNNNLNIDQEFSRADKSKPIVVFGSFQDLLGTNESGGIKTKNEFIHATLWDLVIFDEYHFGAWKERAKELFEKEDEENAVEFDAEKYQKDEASNAINETWLPISTKYYLFLSGTPFRAINNGEFIEEQIFNWTYSDEQRAKANWKGADNPYLSLPRMVMLTYRMPDQIQDVARQGEFDEFDLNLFFAAEGKGDSARFKYENEVQKWLDLIRGAYLPASIDDLKLGQDKRPPMPFSDARLLGLLSHTLWFLPNVASCFAMANLLKQRQNRFYHDYNVIVCAGTGAGIGLDALYPVQVSMGNPLKTKTITLTCGKLTTGVTVKPWTGIFMLRNLKSPETYFQAAFRVQSPWEVRNEIGDKTIMKKECYVFDFALDRALRQISDYSCRLDINESNPEAKVGEFIKFLPVLAYDGSSMKEVNAQDILDIALAGTSATLLAKRWESALLVNVDNDTLKRLLDSPEAMKALMNIEGFRNLNSDISTIINKSEAIKNAKKKKTEASQKEKKELSNEEKEIKSKRKQIQEKLIKFATRIPVFMYLTDYRERCLKDVITQLEPGLFKKVTGLSVVDFNMLCSLGVFNAPLMNDAIFKFKRYEDASLTYTGINRHAADEVGGWDTTIRKAQYEKLFYNQQSSMLSEDYDSYSKDKTSIISSSTIIEPEQTGPMKMEPPSVVSSETVSQQGQTETDVRILLDRLQTGSIVTHKKFGKGEVVKFNNNEKYLYVRFIIGEKKFIFPDAFLMGFLEIE